MNKILLFLLIILSFSACESLDVENTNEPDREKILSNTRDLKIFASNIYLTYWQALKGDQSDNIYLASLVGADQFTSSWFNFGCYEFSSEPRLQWNNSVNYEYSGLSSQFYSNMYTVLYMSNTLINQIKNGAKLSSDSSVNMGYMCMAYLMQGLALGQLAITYDQAQVVTENSDINNLKFVSYKVVTDSAVASLEKAIDMASKYNFNLGNTIINGVGFTSDLVSRVSHSSAARFMVLSARTKAENNQTDWKKVYTYTKPDVAINEDFGPYGDGGIKWDDQMVWSTSNTDNNSFFFAKIDCRLLKLMDPAYPAHYPASGRPPHVHADKRIGEASSADQRLNKYFEYSNTIRFLADRGVYHYSHYRYKRFDNIAKSKQGKYTEIRVYENSLYNVEASVMLGVNSNAINMLNLANNPRVKDGALPSIAANADKKTVLDAIFYEREIELLGQGYLMGFCDMRRRDMLQLGTPLHLPVPALELQTLLMPVYTYGGVDKADGTNTSNGGW